MDAALSKHRYELISKVGEGAFGAAFLVRTLSGSGDDSKAVIKMIDLQSATERERQEAFKESQVLSSLTHPYIVRYRESFSEGVCLWIVMDYCVGGNLDEHIKTMPPVDVKFPQEQVLRWFTQAILALSYLHHEHILHRDLKSRNFFVSRNGNIKMGDFGLAKVLECTSDFACSKVGTPNHMAPEICEGKPYSWGCDIWSMACVLYEMCARRVLFGDRELRKLVRHIMGGPIPELPAEYTRELRHLCKAMLDRDPRGRPPAEQILREPEVKEMVKKLASPSTKSDLAATALEASELLAACAEDQTAATSPSNASLSPYHVKEEVEHYSERHDCWLPAEVVLVDPHGGIALDVNPSTLISLEEQATKVRKLPSSDRSMKAVTQLQSPMTTPKTQQVTQEENLRLRVQSTADPGKGSLMRSSSEVVGQRNRLQRPSSQTGLRSPSSHEALRPLSRQSRLGPGREHLRPVAPREGLRPLSSAAQQVVTSQVTAVRAAVPRSPSSGASNAAGAGIRRVASGRVARPAGPQKA